MPRRQFIADLELTQGGPLPAGISSVKAGEDDGQIELLYNPQPTTLGSGPIRVVAVIPELADYPKRHEYIIFTDGDISSDAAAVLANINTIRGKTVRELVERIAAAFSRAARPEEDGAEEFSDSQDFDDVMDFEDEVDIYDSDHEAFASTQGNNIAEYTNPVPTAATASSRAFRNRLRADLRTAKDAGFKVGHLGNILDGGKAIITISIRIAKLGISEEAMQAWQLEPSEYLILVIRYPQGYRTNEDLQHVASRPLTAHVGMKVLTGRKYKPSLQQALDAFATTKNEPGESTSLGAKVLDADSPEGRGNAVRTTFISQPLAALLNERLVHILRFRSGGLTWLGAETLFNILSGEGNLDSHAYSIPDICMQPDNAPPSLPRVVRADHYANQTRARYSFPLLAMQFLLRHFVRCTEFCLVCHSKLDSSIQAIKPYVCDKGLCLYQYMTLGFGPNIEHEILTQPFVVDLLVSFCYISAISARLTDLPSGLSLRVPFVNKPEDYAIGWKAAAVDPTTKKQDDIHQVHRYEVGFDLARLDVLFWHKTSNCPVRNGDWIVLTISSDETKELHCRVRDVSFYPRISVHSPVTVHLRYGSVQPLGKGIPRPLSPRTVKPTSAAEDASTWQPASLHMYDRDFDSLQQQDKGFAICRLLDTLPTVVEMRDFLVARNSMDLKIWPERVSSSALSILRWIIASNRACIMQMHDNLNPTKQVTDPKPPETTLPGRSGSHEQVFGMKGYMQFRFAMGAPDKEQRFRAEVEKTRSRLRLQYPTIFAWHGSPIWNWHMIIRQGLHYNNVDHGRAYGNGVYHSNDAHVSCGYSSGPTSPVDWPGSVLRVSSALALNEIVNAPMEFQSRSPHYVVQYVDWIQTRVLFVRCNPKLTGFQLDATTKPSVEHPQDPTSMPKGNHGVIAIPMSIIRSGSHNTTKRASSFVSHEKSPAKRLKSTENVTAPTTLNDVDALDDATDSYSVVTDIEDLEILFDEVSTSDPADMGNASAGTVPSKLSKPGVGTDFEPGTLDYKSLPLLPTPIYAISTTTTHLMRELKSLQRVRNHTALGELGWYVDFEKIDNVYQWIVELHSFHNIEISGKPIPLVGDMKKKKIKSIVLEVRFNKDFPYTPPYIRVIRPRFLPLANGGGGHIVAGGAMCMELLTNTGWSSVSSMESVFMQVRLAIASEPFARLDMRAGNATAYVARDYGAGEAADGYTRAVRAHGWEMPPGFKEMAIGTGSKGDESSITY